VLLAPTENIQVVEDFGPDFTLTFKVNEIWSIIRKIIKIVTKPLWHKAKMHQI